MTKTQQCFHDGRWQTDELANLCERYEQETVTLREQLAAVQKNLAHQVEVNEAMAYEMEIFRGITPTPEAGTFLSIWSNCLDNMVYPKAHWIDSLGKTTRRLNSDKLRAEEKVTGLERDCAELTLRLKACLAALRTCEIGSCTCMTKTPEVLFHAEDCRYRLLQELQKQCEA